MKNIAIRKLIKPYAQPNLMRSTWQIVNTLLPLMILYGLQGLLYVNGWWALIPIFVLPTAAFMVRTFILFHDCTHMALFKSSRSNIIWGHILGIFAFTPYYIWREDHNRHHGTVGNLDKRGIGDIWTMTVDEYLNSSKFKRFYYRIYRNPIILFFIAPMILFGLLNRFPTKKYSKKNHLSLLITNIGILVIALIGVNLIGMTGYLIVQLVTLYFAGMMGIWLFYVQHQFDAVYWENSKKWDFVKAAIEGSSYYKLPKVLQWFSGNIGYHHVHHLNPRIPNYNLPRCHKILSGIESPYTVTFFKSFRLAMLHLYDETSGRLISYRALFSNRL